MKKISLVRGASSDAILLMAVKLVTTVLGLATTRLLSEYLSVYDYGTYSQILLIVSIVGSATILGMMDGINYFYHAARDPQEKEDSVSAVFTLQCLVGTVAGCLVMLLSAPLCAYFENQGIRNLLVFAAVLPVLQNLISMLQVLLISVGKASLLALRNFIVSVVRLLIVLVVVLAIHSVAIVLLTTVILDVAQTLVFYVTLRKKGCRIYLKKIRWDTIQRIARYCAPMAVFTVVSALGRDIDKFLVALWTDTQTLAMYTNASKILPFDIVITSFTTVLLPQISKSVASADQKRAVQLYRHFLEIAYISTIVLCCAALSASPQLMKLLYSNKYLDGLDIFCIYIVVDMFRFTNITMVLSAAGKTGLLMVFSVGAVILNFVLNIALYHLIGLEGLALATLITTLVLGGCILCAGAKELGCGIGQLFDGKFLLLFAVESMVLTFCLYQAQKWLEKMDVHYFLILLIICGTYGLTMLLLNGKRLLRLLKQVNSQTGNS